MHAYHNAVVRLFLRGGPLDFLEGGLILKKHAAGILLPQKNSCTFREPRERSYTEKIIIWIHVSEFTKGL